MPTFRKVLIGPGVYATPSGTSVVTPERIRKWVDQFKAMKADQIKVPIAWGHPKNAVPATEEDKDYWRARFNAGKVENLEIDAKTGELVLTGNAPGVEIDSEGRLTTLAELDGQKVRTAIEEVSLGAHNWTDGKGREWPDALVHVGLTPLPVDHGRTAFEPVSVDGPVTFSTVSLLHKFATGAPMESEKKPEKEEKKPEEGKKPEFPEKEEGEESGMPEGDDANGQPPIGDVLADLGSIGLPLPEGTTDANLKERICVACKVKRALEQGDQANGNQPQPGGAAVVEQQPGTFMSTLATHTDPRISAMATRLRLDDQATRLTRIKKLAARKWPNSSMPCIAPAVIKELEEEASHVQFALTDTGAAVVHPLDKELSRLERSLPPEKLGDWTKGAVAEPPPEGEKAKRKPGSKVAMTEEQEETVAYMASVASGKGGKVAKKSV